ncbi:DUF1585 domain-containing protein [Myxococcaceae bacterium JPH2]|nr:DUF1585 domain-containing protein [Myxococcaceae bacterium JPH2]
MPSVRCLGLLAGAAILLSLPASAEDAVCAPVAKVPLERHLRQLSLDLLGRPPTLEEYQVVQAKGSITAEDIQAMMKQESFYQRMRTYHRALLRSNISASVYDAGDSRVGGAGTATSAYGFANNPSAGLRGLNGVTCDSYIAQDDCNKLGADGKPLFPAQDPHAEPAVTEKKCRDEKGVPLPVSYDYDTSYYKCTQLDVTDTTLTDCTVAKSKPDVLPAKYLYFCDMRRIANGTLHPFLCLPDPAKNTTSALTVEQTDTGGNVVAFAHPNPETNPTLARLDRCTLTLNKRNNVNGTYAPPRGCLEREGYVMKPAPYWATTADPVKVCAIEAQERPANPWTLESCETTRFVTDRTCGCGVGMRRCEVTAVHNARVAAFNQEPERIADSVLRRDEPYFNILTTRRSFINGTLAEFYRQKQGVGVFSVNAPGGVDALPALAYSDVDTWTEYTRDAPHSGILTTPAFLYRFPTQRSRVNEFYDSFLCKTFSPAQDASLPPPEDACNRENNLAKRCGCNYCHATIEPTGAHWGRYGERVALYLPPDQFPRYDPKCRDCALNGDTSCGGECAQYVMQAYDGDGANSLGLLKTYLYRTADEEKNIEGGPALLVQRMMQTGDLERCAVKRIWNEFLGRPMTAEEQSMYLVPFSQDFAKSGHRLKALIERVVMSDAYRRID